MKYSRTYGVFSIFLAGWVSVAPASAETSCKDWTRAFFRNADAAGVYRCVRAGSNVNARDSGGNTPLHYAATDTARPAVIAALLKAGADVNAKDSIGRTPLKVAAQANDNPAVITALLKAGADVNAKDKYGGTPLHGAAYGNDNPAVITALLKAGADVNAKNSGDWTPLGVAAYGNDNPAIITALVKAGADVNGKDQYDGTPLHNAAAGNDNPVVITALVKAGADVNAKDEYGRTPLQQATQRAGDSQKFVAAFSEEAVAAFREKERRLRAAANKRRIQERLQGALVSCDKWNTSGFFRNAGAADVSRCVKTTDPNARDEKGRTPLHKAAMFSKTPAVVPVLVKAGATLNGKDGDGRTPLHLTGAFGETPAMVAALVKAGADTSAQDGKGRTPLEFAEKFSKTPAIVAALRKATVKRGTPTAAAQGLCDKWNTPAFFKNATLADLLRCLKTKDPGARSENGRTPLHYAAQGREPSIVTALATAGADVNARDQRGGWTPLHLAAWFGEVPAVVDSLLAAGADPGARDNTGKTPWEYARANPALKGMDFRPRTAEVPCEHWNTKAFFGRADAADVSRCLKAGAKVSARDETGRTVLHLAALYSQTPAVVNTLVKAGARVTARDETGATPLHAAATKSKTPAIVKALLDAGASPAARDETGKTPRDYAKANLALKGADLHPLLEGSSCEAWNTKVFFARANAADVVRCLKAGAQVSARDEAGMTPLHAAASRSGTPGAVKALLDAGADAAARDKQNKTPWDYAKRNPALKSTDVYWQLNEGRFD